MADNPASNTMNLEPRRPPSSRYAPYIVLLLLLMCSAISLWPGVSGPFLFDDESNIPKSFITEFSFDELAAATWANTSGSLKRPVAALSFALSQYSSGPEADGFKIHNIFIHLSIGLLLFFLARRIFLALGFTDSQQQWGAIICCAFWLLHPLHISTVLYPVQRMAQLSALFSLLAFYSYIRARQNPFRQFLWLYIALPSFMLLAILSKENGALIPVFLLLIEFVLFRFNKAGSSLALRSSWWLFIFTPLALAIIYSLSHPGLINYSNRSFSLVERCYTQLWVVAYYLKMIALPNIADMGIFHDDISIIKHWQQSLPAALLHLTLLLSAIFCLRKLPLLSLGIGWFYIGHLMESTVLPLEMIFEHRNYLASIGVAIIFAGAIIRLSQKPSINLLAFILLCHFATSSFERATAWSNSTSLYQTNAINHPKSARAHIAYANELLLKREYELAAQLLIRAAELNPVDAGPLLHLIKLSCFGPMSFHVNFYPHLQQHYQNNPLSAYGQQSLHQISKLAFDQHCQNLNRSEFLSILAIIEKYNPKRRAELLLIKARLNSEDDIEKAMAEYEESYRINPDPRTLSEQAATLIKHKKNQQAKKIVEQLLLSKNNLSPTRLREFKELFNWYDRHAAN